ncbi:MAG: dihydroorotate dehydrogenase 2, partial [Rickettsiales bacterium]
INISSPNTKNLRDIQNPENLNLLLEKINNLKINLKNQQHKNTPIFLKIAPDLDLEQLKSIAELSLQYEIDAVIISNTTIARNFNLLSTCQNEAGGLSGKPLFEKSTEILKQFYQLTEGKIPLIATGGISSKEDALLKIKNGASLIQIYSAFIYQGFGLVEEIKKYLSSELDKNNLQNISQLVGINHKF